MSGPAPDHLADPSARVSAWNVANALTVLRVLMVPLFVWLIVSDDGGDGARRWWAAAVFVVASATDWVDGELARRHGLVTDFGKIADPIADKALMGAALVGLSFLGELPWWVTVVILVREVGITLMRFWVIRHEVIPASRGGKLKTALQAFGLVLLLVPVAVLQGIGLWVMYAAVVVTVLTGLDYVVSAVRAARARRG